jgi:hypothetical protein
MDPLPYSAINYGVYDEVKKEIYTLDSENNG